MTPEAGPSNIYHIRGELLSSGQSSAKGKKISFAKDLIAKAKILSVTIRRQPEEIQIGGMNEVTRYYLIPRSPVPQMGVPNMPFQKPALWLLIGQDFAKMPRVPFGTYPKLKSHSRAKFDQRTKMDCRNMSSFGVPAQTLC
jgi:hypothetical protein